MANYEYKDGGFEIEGFDRVAPFCSFLPGLTGANGIPMWSFYCNRGQGICSFGIDNKDNAIMEFFPANAAYQHVSMLGFRTYINTGSNKYEPFLESGGGKRVMKIFPNSFSISEETDDFLFEVKYFILPEENFPALVRRCTLTNKKKGVNNVKVLDGMPQITPYGVTTGSYKSMSNLQKSWSHVSGLEKNMPFFHILTVPGDDVEVKTLQGAYFYLSFSENGKPIRPFIDPDLIFDYALSFTLPQTFPDFDNVPEVQVFANRFACALTPVSASLKEGESVSWNSLIGFAGVPEDFSKRIGTLCDINWIDEKEKQAVKTASAITDVIATSTGEPLLDGYFRQSYMDNILRGGVPFVLGDKIIHLFSRKHGDPERDYNFFSIAAEYFSQGNGNFRDVCQNRRSDVLFCPEAGEFNILTFFSLMQADGFNPLEIRGSTFDVRVENADKLNSLLGRLSKAEPIRKLTNASFSAGAVINTILRENIELSEGTDVSFLIELLSLCDQNIEAVYGEGYWIDHWTYLMDLVDTYKFMYPDKINDLLFNNKKYRFFDSPVRVLPRKEAYVYKNNTVVQINSLQHIKNKPQSGWLKDKTGEYYSTNLFSKMLCLGIVKYSSLDPVGCGLEMNGGRPGWNDAMNGLPALFGSGLSEALELRRMLEFVNSVTGYGEVSLPNEVYELFIKEIEAEKFDDDYSRWDYVCLAAEKYREGLLNGFDGAETAVSEEKLRQTLCLFISRLKKGAEKAVELGGGLIPTYLTFEPVKLDENHFPLEFVCKPLPHFLEGPVRQMKTLESVEKCREVYNAIKVSEMYDEPLGMYRTSVSLDKCGYNIGRIRSFTPGWQERESIFMHMEFKYLLEMIKSGLYDEFYSDIKTALPPFMNPSIYKRSTLEGSSFIASSNNPDPNSVGRGFVSRLSGSTAEVISMWKAMFMGDEIFSVKDGELNFTLKPRLAGWLFDNNNKVQFTMFGKIPVTYHNPNRLNTYGADGATVQKITVVCGGVEIVSQNGIISGETAHNIRNCKADAINVELN